MNESVVSREKQELFLKDLRQQTGESHTRLEENEFSKAILTPSVTLADYQVYIAKLYGVTIACENDIFPLLAEDFPDLEGRYKSQLILEDLLKTGFSAEEIASLPVYKFESATLGAALGVMYVLEGSTLGGRILYKHMNQNLGLDAENGASYFWGYGQDTGSFWKVFITKFADLAAGQNCENEVISNAVSTFDEIGNWLNDTEIKRVK